MMRKFILLVFLVPGFVQAQENHQKCKEIVYAGEALLLDSLTVIPESIVVSDTAIVFHYDPSSGMISFPQLTTRDTVRICFQTIPYQLHKNYYRKLPAEYREQQVFQSPVSDNNRILDQKEELFPTDNLQKSGSLSRGISFGNTQNVVVNSALNLQLEGKLSDNLNIRASITDQNVPFQPEGNTAQIQDFDNIFLEIYNDDFSVRGGDVVFRNRDSEFLRYYKNVQGGLLSTKYKFGNSSAETTLGISGAKGKFASIQLEVEEGVSGPYRIKIPDGNDFIIILANSERVFLDGKQLQRGFNYDYVIDYNKAEIQFTTSVLITKFSRVRIDVEYSDQNYSRSIITGSHYQKSGKASFSFNYYSEKDNPNNPLSFTLSDDDVDLMRGIGDSLDLGVRSGAQEAEYNQDEVQYQYVDTLDGDGNSLKIYQYSIDQEATLYRVSFSDLGQGMGDYILTNSTANGRIYEWVSPIAGISQGRYSPVNRIPAPNKKEMITIGASFDVSKYEKVFVESAFSNNDVNLFSTLDDGDNHGIAMKGGFVSERRPVNFMKDYRFSARADYEIDNAFFSAIDRFRYIEFDRDWNYSPNESKDQSADHIFNAGFGLEKDAFNKLSYRLVKRKRDIYVDGLQQYADFYRTIGRLQVKTDVFFLRNSSEDFDSKWNRFVGEISYKSSVLTPGYRFTLDENTVYAQDTDSVTSTAMNYREHTFFLNSNDTLKTKFGLSYSIREDKSPVLGELERGNTSGTAQFFVTTAASPNQKLHFLLTYRNNRNYLAPDGPKNEETLMARTDWYAGLFKRHVRSDLTYAIGNGRELRREFVFVQVPTGEGTHTWRDDNGDSVQDLSEFYIAVNPDEKNYIKIFVPTSDYIFAYENNFNYRLNLEFPRSWSERGGMLEFLSKISNNSSWSIIRRITDDNIAARLLPFYSDIAPEDVLSQRENVRTRFFFNRANPGFGAEFGYNRASSKQLLTQGFESRRMEEYTANTRYNLSRRYTLKVLCLWGPVWSNSDFLQGRVYRIDQFKLTPELAWQPSPKVRLSMIYGFSDKINETGEPQETATINEISTVARISKATDFSLDALVKYSDIAFSGNSNTPAAYEMLEALQPGNNLVWNFTLQKKILQGLQLSMVYEGRKSEERAAVHIGRMQVSALF
ncbi:MAG: hypothetical protein U5K79_15915 [Cyclobacteriaceae bacterium]|nr:hypothetical protein [Cyclobacteriaceae bacterium]